MTDWTSTSRRIAAVDVFWERDGGEIMSGLGSGREVRCGFWARAVCKADRDDGGVMRCMSLDVVRTSLS